MPHLLSIKFPGLNPAAALRAVPVAAAPVADFMATLGAMLLPGVAAKAEGELQLPADSGKDLPVDAETVDPLLAWLPDGAVVLPMPALVAVAPGLSLKTPTLPTQQIEGTGALPFVDDRSPVEAEAAPAPGKIPLVETPVVEAAAETEPAIFTVDPEPIADKADLPLREQVAPLAPRAAPVQLTLIPLQPQAPLAVAAAAQTFAAAIAAPAGDPAVTLSADAIVASVAANAADQLRTTIQAANAADQAPLDLSRDDWTGAMIERITALRDAAEAADTRIRLAPENLGSLEISIRRDGDRMHVHFVAENPVTRQLLADAASQFTELANARGVKLGGTSVDSGTGGQPGTPRQPEPKLPARPVSAGGPETDLNERIA